ncbi:MAG TPA: hypothetical protein VFX19_04875 [Dehalococcoidia bacterium]|nr:hypothetical protein [Dehalococcoidia bacterium]
MPDRCAIKGMLAACGAPATAQCVYCGRPFCEKHGVILEEGEEVCSRKNCVAKRDDLRSHLIYKAAVTDRNRERHCGLQACEQDFSLQCGRCKGFFCTTHAFLAPDSVNPNEPLPDHPPIICRHCHERRPIWQRE